MLVARPRVDMTDTHHSTAKDELLDRLAGLALQQTDERAAILMDISDLCGVGDLFKLYQRNVLLHVEGPS